MFYFRLALALGCTVAELLERVSSTELTEWQAYYSLEPFGAHRDNFHAAIIASVVANVNRDPKRKAKAFSTQDFMLQAAKKEQSETNLYSKFRSWALMAQTA